MFVYTHVSLSSVYLRKSRSSATPESTSTLTDQILVSGNHYLIDGIEATWGNGCYYIKCKMKLQHPAVPEHKDALKKKKKAIYQRGTGANQGAWSEQIRIIDTAEIK